jgi:hypothetical protein
MGFNITKTLTENLAFDAEDFLAKFRSQLQEINDEINGLSTKTILINGVFKVKYLIFNYKKKRLNLE